MRRVSKFGGLLPSVVLFLSLAGTAYAQFLPAGLCPPPGRWVSGGGGSTVCQCPNGQLLSLGQSCAPSAPRAVAPAAYPPASTPAPSISDLQKDLEQDQERGEQQFVETFPEWAGSRNARLDAVNNAFEQEYGTSFDEYLQQQRSIAWQLEQSLPTAARDQLNASRLSAIEQIQAYADGLSPQQIQGIATFESPLRAVLNPNLSDAVRLAPTVSSGGPSIPSAPSSGSSVSVLAQSTFAPLTQEQQLSFASLTRDEQRRLVLEAERAYALTLDNVARVELNWEILFRTGAVAGGPAVRTVGLIKGGQAGEAATGAFYDGITAAAGILLGTESVEEAAAKAGAKYTASQAGIPAPASIVVDFFVDGYFQTSDWLHQSRMLEQTKTR
jgi:hypothetical protein